MGVNSSISRSFVSLLLRKTVSVVTLRLAHVEKLYPYVSVGFKNSLDSLPNSFSSNNRNIFFEFFENHGTHYVSEVVLGGHCLFQSELESSGSEMAVAAEMRGKMEAGIAEAKLEVTASNSVKVEKSLLKISYSTNGGGKTDYSMG